MKSPRLTSPRSSGAKQLKNFSLTGLNSYKIDTSSLEQKAKQIQLLKNELQTQISQYKSSEMMFHEESANLIQQNQQLKGKIKKLQTELNKVKTQHYVKQKTKETGNLAALNNRITSLQMEINILEKKIKKKDQYIKQLQEYKKMYQIQVENKNNITNFYETKLATFKKDKMTLISKYEQKISVLGSGLQMNGTIIQGVNSNNNNAGNPSNVVKNSVYTSKLNNYSTQFSNNPKKITLNSKQQANNLSNSNGINNQNNQNNQNPSNKSIKIIRSPRQSKQNAQTNKQSEVSQRLQSQAPTPYKLLKISSQRQTFKYQTPINSNSKGNKIQLNQISIDSSSSLGKKQQFRSSDKFSKKNQSNNNVNSTNKITNTNKTIKSDSNFLSMVKQIFGNLKRQNLKSQNLKSFNSIKSFINLPAPTQTQIIQLFQSFPFAPLDMQMHDLQVCIDKMKKHLIKKYSTFSGNLLMDTIIDKIQDFQIANQVNSEDQGQIIAGLSSNQDDQ